MKKPLLIFLKWLIITYLASQAFFEIDVIQALVGYLLGFNFELPFGLNVTNLILFGVVAIYIIRKEWGRAKQIRYTFSPETNRILKSEVSTDQFARKKSELFKQHFEKEMEELSLCRLPPTMPLQLEDILTTDGFKFDEGDEEDSVLQYVEELSPLEIATNALFNWLRNESLYKQFTLELHFKNDEHFVSVNSGNPDTDSFIRIGDSSENIPALARDATRRVFFEAESRLCRNFDVFNIFYEIVALINHLETETSENKKNILEISIHEKLDDALKKEPEFLTLQLLQGIIWFLNPSKDTNLIDQAEKRFEGTKNNAETYFNNFKRLRRAKTFGSSTEVFSNLPMVDKKVFQYLSGLSRIFLARVFCQRAHRFGFYDGIPEQFKEDFKRNLKSINKATNLIHSASPNHGRRFPLAYRIRAFSYHCHDFFDKDEVFYDSRTADAKPEKISDSGRDLKQAVEVYSNGIEICDEIKSKTPEFALHHKDALANQRGFSNLYFSLIEAKRRNIALRKMPEFALAEQDLLWSFACGTQRKRYALANLSVLYGMAGEFDFAAKAGICSQIDNIAELVTEYRVGERPPLALEGKPNSRTIEGFKTILNQTWNEAGAEYPSLENPFSENWAYFEGINELSYGFVFKGLLQLFGNRGNDFDLSNLSIGLRLHTRSLEVLCETQFKDKTIFNQARTRFSNTITNFVRAFWHFDDRASLPDGSGQTFDQIRTILSNQIRVFAPNIDIINSTSAASCIQVWLASVREAIESVHGSKIEVPKCQK